MLIVIMGVSGSGKTTIGTLVARRLGWKFYDADDFHSEANIEKMSGGTPLDDEDRKSWLIALTKLVRKSNEERTDLVLACSALKESFRNDLTAAASGSVRFVLLEAGRGVLEARLRARANHFMKASMLDGQLRALEDPKNALRVDVTGEAEGAAARIVGALALS